MSGRTKLERILTSDTLSAVVKVVQWSNDDRDVRIYQVPRDSLNFLQRYLMGGTVSAEVRNDLAEALSNCPAWADRSLEDLDATQRQAIVGILVTATFQEIEVDCEVNLPAN